MHCSSCGASLPPNSDFCPFCGTQIGGTDAPYEAPPPQSEAGPWGTPSDDDATMREQTVPVEDASLGEEERQTPWPKVKTPKAPRSSLREPPRPKMALWKKIVVWILSLVVLGVIGLMALGLWLTSFAVRAVTQHLDLVMTGKLSSAYERTAETFQQHTPERDYVLFVRSSPSLTRLAYYSVGARDMDDDRATVKMTLTDRGGDDTPAAFDLIKENSEWRIVTIRLGADADLEPMAVSTKTTETPANTDPNARKSSEEDD